MVGEGFSILHPHPLMLSLSKHVRSARSRGAFDKLRLSGFYEWGRLSIPHPHPLMLSLSKHVHSARSRGAFDKLRLSGFPWAGRGFLSHTHTPLMLSLSKHPQFPTIADTT